MWKVFYLTWFINGLDVWHSNICDFILPQLRMIATVSTDLFVEGSVLSRLSIWMCPFLKADEVKPYTTTAAKRKGFITDLEDTFDVELLTIIWSHKTKSYLILCQCVRFWFQCFCFALFIWFIENLWGQLATETQAGTGCHILKKYKWISHDLL